MPADHGLNCHSLVLHHSVTVVGLADKFLKRVRCLVVESWDFSQLSPVAFCLAPCAHNLQTDLARRSSEETGTWGTRTSLA